MVFQLILIMLREFQETIKTIEQLKKRKHSSSVFLIIFIFLKLFAREGPLLKNRFFMVKLNEICIFEASFPASWAEAQSWKQLICYFV